MTIAKISKHRMRNTTLALAVYSPLVIAVVANP
jgi:hypothetical protein